MPQIAVEQRDYFTAVATHAFIYHFKSLSLVKHDANYCPRTGQRV